MPIFNTEECLELDHYLKQDTIDSLSDTTDIPEYVNYLFDTIKEGNYALVRDLLNDPGLCNIDSCDNQGMTALAVAARYGYANIAALLLEKGACVNAKDNNGMTPLMLAIKYENEDVVKLLLEKNAEVESYDPENNTPLQLAIEANRLTIIELLLKHNANPVTPFRKGYFKHFSPLTFALYCNNVKLFELLVENGASIQSFDGRGKTPLEEAVDNLRYGCLKIIANHPDPKVRESVIIYCVETNNSKVLRQYLESMSPEFKLNLFKETTSSTDNPITTAFQKCRLICARLLLNHGISLIEPGNEASEEAVISRLNNQSWRLMLETYNTEVQKHEKTPTLTMMAADVAYRSGQQTKTPIQNFGIPLELQELCHEAPLRFDLKSKYMSSQRIKSFLKDSLSKPNEEITKLIKGIQKKRHRRRNHA